MHQAGKGNARFRAGTHCVTPASAMDKTYSRVKQLKR